MYLKKNMLNIFGDVVKDTGEKYEKNIKHWDISRGLFGAAREKFQGLFSCCQHHLLINKHGTDYPEW